MLIHVTLNTGKSGWIEHPDKAAALALAAEDSNEVPYVAVKNADGTIRLMDKLDVPIEVL